MKEILEYKLFEIGNYSLTVWSLVQIAMIFIAARAVILFFNRIFKRFANRRGWDTGRQKSISLLFQYIVYLTALTMILGVFGIQLTFLLVSSSALLVGLGLGLQTVFSDIVSGIFILFEGTVEVGDIVEVNGMVGRIEEINLRTTKFRNRDDLTMIIPNHFFINEKVVNWSHNENHARFGVSVGVAYKSDVEKVKKILLDCAVAHPKVLTNNPELLPDVRMTGFGDSSVNFDLLFYSENLFRIETTKSDLRFAIFHAFRENGVEIPFPQRDLHIQRD